MAEVWHLAPILVMFAITLATVFWPITMHRYYVMLQTHIDRALLKSALKIKTKVKTRFGSRRQAP
jgi:hypothetical protein